MVPLGERPDEVLDRRVPGHWEGDLLVGRYGHSHLVTLVERHSRYLLVLPLTDATTTTVVAAVTAAVQQLPPIMRRSPTWDRGVQMLRCTEYAPWGAPG
jgi:IS30 family transposase